jgi:hypothetical protein
MPEINKIPEVLYNGNQPYHVHYDNLPLKNILSRIDLVNAQVDINSDILRGCSGSMGTLSDRISVSIQDDGNLKTDSIDNAEHNIGAHSDGAYQGIQYVRMKKDERDKLGLIDPGATNFRIEIEDSYTSMDSISQIPSLILFDNPILKLRGSDTIFFDFEAPDIVKAHSVFPPGAAHQNLHNITPNLNDPVNPNYAIWSTNGIAFRENTLRVYINGFRINYGAEKAVRVLTAGANPALSASWKSFYIFDTNPTSGVFFLNIAISGTDVIVVDFDIDYSI